MTNKDFENILFESFDHNFDNSYFESKREAFKYTPIEYANGLFEAFKRLEVEVNKTDYTQITYTINGEDFDCELLPTDKSTQIKSLQDEHGLQWKDFTFQKKIEFDVKQWTNGKYKGTLSPELLYSLWPELERYLQTILTEVSPSFKKKHIIKNDDTTTKIYNLCNDEIFTCNYLTFRDCLEVADFDKLTIIVKTKLQHLTYKISGIMDNDWYGDVCKNMKWEKTTCSGFKKAFKDDNLIKKIEKVIQEAIK